jgi:hypothetical protein
MGSKEQVRVEKATQMPKVRASPPELPAELEKKIRKATSVSYFEAWRLESGHQMLPKSGLMRFELSPPKHSVARKNKWAAEWKVYNYRNQFIIAVPSYFGDPGAEKHYL